MAFVPVLESPELLDDLADGFARPEKGISLTQPGDDLFGSVSFAFHGQESPDLCRRSSGLSQHLVQFSGGRSQLHPMAPIP